MLPRFKFSIVVLCIFFLNQLFLEAAISLRYKTPDESLKIDGFTQDRKPYHFVEGNPVFLSETGVFSVNGSVDEIVNYGFFPLVFTREKYVEKGAILGSSNYGSESLNHILHTGDSENLYLTGFQKSKSGVGSNISKIWSDGLPEHLVLIVGWFDPQENNHSAEVQYFKNTDEKESVAKYFNSRYEKISDTALYPVLFLFDSQGQFVPIAPDDQTYTDYARALASIIRDDSSVLSDCIEKSPGLLSADIAGQTLLEYASEFASTASLKLLIDLGADTEKKGLYDLRPIHLAARAGHADAVKLLIDEGANINASDKMRNNVLHHAASLGHLSVCKTLLENKVKRNSKNKQSETAVFIAGANRQPSILRYLCLNGAKFGFKKKNRQILLDYAIRANDLDVVAFLLEKGAKADVELGTAYPIHIAAQVANGAIVRKLIEAGADPNQVDSNGVSPLMRASERNYDGMVALIEAGAEVNAMNKGGYTALYVAIAKKQLEITKYLLDHGADPNLKIPGGKPLMWLATASDNRIGLNALIQAGAICTMDISTSLPIMEYAFRYDIPEIVEITLSQCLEADFLFYEKFPSYWVAEYYQSEMVRSLLEEHGIDPDDVASPKFTPFEQVKDQLKLIQKADLVYPQEIQEKYGDFTSIVELIINTDGSVILPRIVQNPAPEMSRKILETLVHWKFRPMFVEEQPVVTRVKIPLKFVPTAPEPFIYEIAGVEIPPKPHRMIEPTYPSSLKRKKVNGRVIVVFVVDEEGNVVAPRVESSTHEAFEQPALNSISRWKFSPGYINGEPVKVRVRAPLVFQVH